MSHPDLIAQHLDDEEVIATVNLSGEDALVVTPTRSLRYESEGILSDESVTEYPHDVESIAVSAGRRRATLELTYPIEGEKQLQVPKNRLDPVLHYLLAGVFHVKNITSTGETVRSVFQFNELTVVITSERVLSHVGSLVWDDEYDEYRYGDLSGLTFQEGSIATEIVLYVEGRSHRIKVPNARAAEVERALEEAILEHFDVDSIAAFNELVDEDESSEEAAGTRDIGLDETFQPLGTEHVENTANATEQEAEPLESWPYELDVEDESIMDLDELKTTIETLQDAIDEQREILAAQEEAIADLAELLPEN